MGYEDEIYFSIDIETDGPIPAINSMKSLGCAAFLADGTLLSTFSVNIEDVEGAEPDERTMSEFWAKNPDAWEAVMVDQVEPHVAMASFVQWIQDIRETVKDTHGDAKLKTPVAVAYPAGFDWTFVYWYLVRFTGSSPFSFSCLDTKTLAMAVMNKHGYRSSGKRNMPKRWFSKTQAHTHIAVDDAIEQGELFCNMLKDLRRK